MRNRSNSFRRVATSNWILAFAVCALALGIVAMAMTRLVDADEGFYNLAGSLVLQGEVPYRDFFYTQMPLLPYLFGAWIWIFGPSWYALRALSALFTLASGAIVYLHVRRFGGGRGWALLALALYGLSSLVLGWFTIGKTYAFSTAVLLGAYTLVAPLERRTRPAAWAVSGLLIGLAIDARLMFAAAIIPFVYAAARRRVDASRTGRVIPLVLGGLVGLGPSLAVFTLDPKAFVYNNLAFHASRTKGGLVGHFQQKLAEVLQLAGDIQFLSLTIAAATLAVVAKRRARPVSLALWVALALGVVSLLPTPTWTQYFSVTVPFLILACLETVPAFAGQTMASGPLREAAAFVAAVLGAMYVAFTAVGVYRYVAWGNGVPGIQRQKAVAGWRIPAIRRVSRAIDARTRPGEEVVALWPGFIFGTHAKVVNGLETPSSLVAGAHISLESERRYHVISPEGVVALLREHRTRLFVLGQQTDFTRGIGWDAVASKNGYRVVAQLEGGRIYEWMQR